MPKKTAKPKKATKATPAKAKAPGEALMSTAELMRATGLSSPTLSDWNSIGVIEKKAQGKWPMLATLSAIIHRLRSQKDEAGKESREKRNRMEADTAELNFVRASGETCFIEDAKQYQSDFRIAVRQEVDRADFLSQDQKRQLQTRLAAIVIEEPKPEVEK